MEDAIQRIEKRKGKTSGRKLGQEKEIESSKQKKIWQAFDVKKNPAER